MMFEECDYRGRAKPIRSNPLAGVQERGFAGVQKLLFFRCLEARTNFS